MSRGSILCFVASCYTCLEYVEPVSVYHPSCVYMSNTIHQPINPSNDVPCVGRSSGSSGSSQLLPSLFVCVPSLLHHSYTRVIFLLVFVLVVVGWDWLVSWLAACSLIGLPLPYFVIETLRPYLPDALAFIAAAIASLTHQFVMYIHQSLM